MLPLFGAAAQDMLILIEKALKDNPAPSSEFLTKSSSTSPKSFLEETNTFHNSLPEFENFRFDLEEINSGNSFIFDLANDQFPPTDRSDLTHEEFTEELAHIISPPEYDCFYFRNLPDPGELMSIRNFEIRKNLSFTTCVNLPIEDDHSPFLAYVVWIFLAYLTYPVIPPYLYSFGNEDTIFDPGITINRVYSFKPGLSHRCGAFKKFNTHRSHLNEWPMIINGKNTPILDVLLIPGYLKTLAKGFYPPSLNSSASIGNQVSKSYRLTFYLMAYFINDLRFTWLPFKTLRTMFSSSMGGIFDLIVPAAVVTS
nr:hypothetical protein [Tanacetum cinerariifolium]